MRVEQHKRPDRCNARSKNNGRAEQRVVLTLTDRRKHDKIQCKTPSGASAYCPIIRSRPKEQVVKGWTRGFGR